MCRGLPLVLTLLATTGGAGARAAPGGSDPRVRSSGTAADLKLHEAVKAGRVAEVEELLDAGADIEAKPFEFYYAPPLHFAVLKGHRDLVRQLLDNGANVNGAELRHGSTALHVAAARGEYDIASHLLFRGADVNARNKERGHTPLHVHEAARGGFPAVVTLLLDAGAERQSTDSLGEATALHIAAKSGKIEAFAASLLNTSSAEARQSLLNAEDSDGMKAEDHWPEVKEVSRYQDLHNEL